VVKEQPLNVLHLEVVVHLDMELSLSVSRELKRDPEDLNLGEKRGQKDMRGLRRENVLHESQGKQGSTVGERSIDQRHTEKNDQGNVGVVRKERQPEGTPLGDPPGTKQVERRAAGAAWTGPAGEAKAAASGWSRPGSGATVRGVAAQAWCSGEVPQAYTVAQGVGGQPVYLAQAPVQGSGATLVTPRGDLSSHYTVNAAAVTRRY